MSTFVKMYTDTVHSGMAADMGAELFHTLAVIASFANGDGRCFPSQQTLADRMGVTRETANRRIKRLLAYRWQGEPVISAEKVKGGSGWDRTGYVLHRNCGFGIFGHM